MRLAPGYTCKMQSAMTSIKKTGYWISPGIFADPEGVIGKLVQYCRLAFTASYYVDKFPSRF